jgi:hypothetical protein
MQKARSQTCLPPKRQTILLPLVGMWFQALFHSPHRGAFHLSLTVLVHYRLHGSIPALEGGPPSFTPGFSCRALLRIATSHGQERSPTGLSPAPAARSRALQLARPMTVRGSCNPASQRETVSARPRKGADPVRSPLLGASRLISLPPGTEMFQFPGFALPLAKE